MYKNNCSTNYDKKSLKNVIIKKIAEIINTHTELSSKIQNIIIKFSKNNYLFWDVVQNFPLLVKRNPNVL